MKAVARLVGFKAAPLLVTFVGLFALHAHAQQEVAPERFEAKPVPHGKRLALQRKPAADATARRDNSNRLARQNPVVFNISPGVRQGNTGTPQNRTGKRKAPVQARAGQTTPTK